MTCALATLAACFGLSGLHIDSAISMMDSRPRMPAPYGYGYDITYTRNPYGVAAVGYSVEFSMVTWDLQVRHQSSIPAKDYGENTLQLSMSWRPFGRN